MSPLTRLFVIVIAVMLTISAFVAWQRPLRRDTVAIQRTQFRIDINQADAASFALLPGIGPMIGRRIVEHRDEHGPFESVGDLANVKGIGEKTLDRVKPYVTCSSSKAAN